MRHKYTHGFTLVELIMVIIILGIISTTIVVFFKPAMDSFLAVGRRAGITDNTDTTMRKMMRDVRLAVPNSIRLVSPQCFELIPSSTGGRARTGPDTVWDAANPANTSKPLDTNTTVTSFDVLTTLTNTPVVGDWVVVDNQNTNDVYSGTNRAAIASITAPPVAIPSLGVHRITLSGATQFPMGYDAGRFTIVPNSQKAVFYVCDSPGLDANGTGTGKLYRFENYGFNASTPVTCPAPVTTGTTTPVLTNHVESCAFIYSATAGATQEAGLIEATLKITEANESVSLSYGAHVDNVP